MSHPVRVLIAEDDPTLRAALAELISTDERFELTAAAGDAEEAIRLVRHGLPDVAVLDVKMPGGGGPRATREIVAFRPATKIVALSAYDDRETVYEMLRAGALGYIVKGAPAEEILAAIARAAEGKTSLSDEVTSRIVKDLTGELERQQRDSERWQLQRARIEALLIADAFSVVFQPVVDLVEGLPVGYEALSRFRGDPPRPPDVWFREAAEVGLLVDLELAAIRQAIAHFDELPRDTYCSLNLAPGSLASEWLPDTLAGIPPERVVIEVTEHAPVEDYQLLAASLREMRAGGTRLAIDDAGAGFASLRHILRLEPDVIKLDISLTRGIDTDRGRRALASALISFASEMGMVIVAEGIETPDEVETLKGLGVRFGQGFYLGPPAPLAALVR